LAAPLGWKGAGEAQDPRRKGAGSLPLWEKKGKRIPKVVGSGTNKKKLHSINPVPRVFRILGQRVLTG